MLDSFYILSLWIIIAITFIFALFFLILSVPNSLSLYKYKIARYIIACTYVCLGISNLSEVIFLSEDVDIQMVKMITLFVSMFQALLLTYTHITLINPVFVTKKKICLESLPVLICIISGITDLTFDTERKYIDILNTIYTVYYISLLIRYTFIFQRIYDNYRRQMDNFFAEQEFKRFRWILFSFYASLGIGIIALIATFFDSMYVKLVFEFSIICFYSYFGIHFINYAFLFQTHEIVVNDAIDLEEEFNIVQRDYSQLEMNIKQWEENKTFLEQGINIEKVAGQLNTNRTYLSDYANNILQKTFKEWISDLRITEAKRLLLKHPDLSISEISEMAGFSDKSNFGRLFTKQAGMTPKMWRASKMALEPKIL